MPSVPRPASNGRNGSGRIAPVRSSGRRRPSGPAGVRWERRLARDGYCRIAGLDEVGRGSWAGPLVAAAVVLPPVSRGLLRRLDGLRDSKQLAAAERERYSGLIRSCALALGVGIVSAAVVDWFGLSAAGRLAMERAARSLVCQPDYLLIDAFPLRNVHCPQEAIIFGDALCLSIAAASVVAKVERDRLMETLGSALPGYGFEHNKGYGTAAHLRALRTLGPSPEHRRSYAPVRAVLAAMSLP